MTCGQEERHPHGDAYEYVENTILNANTFVNNAAGIYRPPFHRNEFGGDVGGPILKSRAFFFFDYDGLPQRIPVVAQDNLPTAAEKQGNFGALCVSYNTNGVCSATGGVQLYNPQTGQPFPDNVISPGMITSQAKALLAFVPDPDRSDIARTSAGNEDGQRPGRAVQLHNNGALGVQREQVGPAAGLPFVGS